MEWTTKYKTTARTEKLVRRLVELIGDIDAEELAIASVEARAEWSRFCARTPTGADACSGSLCHSDDEVERMIGKVIRFRSILAQLRRGQLRVPSAARGAVSYAYGPAPWRDFARTDHRLAGSPRSRGRAPCRSSDGP